MPEDDLDVLRLTDEEFEALELPPNLKQELGVFRATYKASLARIEAIGNIKLLNEATTKAAGMLKAKAERQRKEYNRTILQALFFLGFISGVAVTVVPLVNVFNDHGWWLTVIVGTVSGVLLQKIFGKDCK